MTTLLSRARVLVGFLALAATSALEAQEVHLLVLGEGVERPLAHGESHVYAIEARPGEFVRLLVEPRGGAELRLELASPEGRSIAQVDRIVEGVARTLSWIADVSGEHRLLVSTPFKGARGGPYEVTLAERRDGEPRDSHRVAAERAAEEAARLSAKQQVEAARQAAARYEDAVALWRAAADPRGEATTRLDSASLYRRRGEYAQGLATLNESLRIWRELEDRRAQALTLDALGEFFIERADYPRALEHLREAHALALETGFRKIEADALNNIGAVHRRTGDYRAAQDHYRRAVAGASEAGDRSLVGIALNNLSLASWRLGELEMALESAERALALSRDLEDRDLEATVLNIMGGAYTDLGLPEEVVRVLGQAAVLKRSVGNPAGEANSLAGLGNAYRRLGQPDKALEHLERALALSRSVNDRLGEAITLRIMGTVHEATGDRTGALERFDRSLEVYRAIGSRAGEASALQHRARIRHAFGEHAVARDDYQQSLHLSREAGDREAEAAALLGLARGERALGHLPAALAAIESSIEILELLRSRLASTDLRATYQAARQDYYQFHVDLLMQLEREQPGAGHAARALQVSERARSRSLLDLLNDTQADLRQGADAALLEKERLFTARISAQEARRRQLLSGKRDAAALASAEQELAELLAQFRDVQAEIRARSPRYAALTQPQPISLKEIQEEVLDDQTVLLEYTLGRDRSFLWAVTRQAFRSVELPPRAEIDTAARRVAELILAARDPAVPETPAQRSRRRARVQAEYREASVRLSQLLLAPVADLLGRKRLVVVADGALHYVPFGALPAWRAAGAPQDPPPLLVEHEVVTVPSASVLAVLRQEQRGRTRPEGTVAVLADPVFGADDVRMGAKRPVLTREARDTRYAVHGALERSARDAGIDGFRRLRFSRDEALAIARLVPAGRALSALDFRASRETAVSPELGRYRIVHFATHGVLNAQHPELSGVVLSLVDEQGRTKDGFLRLHDVYGLSLNADLVVLSGCETALGKEIRGEGLVGLTRGFMYAGAPRVIASLWNVNDRATAKLMGRFYEGLLAGGMTPAAALRRAQVEMWREQPRAVPHLWAAFVLQGEWR
jgi:CHAT domain-containing protein